MAKHYDIVIAGGGLIGITLALALTDTPWQIALIEAKPLALNVGDGRALALSHSSQQIFSQLNIVVPKASPIKKIHISQQHQFGSTLLTSEELGLPALGYVVPITQLYQALHAPLKSVNNLTIYQPATVTALTKNDQQWQIQLKDQLITTSLLIAADGENSFIRQSLNIPITIKDYQQTAIVSPIETSLPHQQQAYERFTAEGILALLPTADYRMTAIWTVPTDRVEDYLSPDLLQKAMGYRVGKITMRGESYRYPLRQVQPQSQAQAGLILLGNAAHALHPVAAQGFNLGLRDTFILAKLLTQIQSLPNDLLIKDYLRTRESDQQKTLQFSQQLMHIFTPQSFGLPFLRGLGLAGFDSLPFLKKKFAWRRMGVY